MIETVRSKKNEGGREERREGTHSLSTKRVQSFSQNWGRFMKVDLGTK